MFDEEDWGTVDWYPGKQETEVESLRARVRELERENARLREQNLNYSWQVNPDRMGGQFSEDEIRRATEWR